MQPVEASRESLHEPVPTATSQSELDQAVADLARRKNEWAAVPAIERAVLLDRLIDDFATITDRWADAVRRAEGLPADAPLSGEEWLVGPYLVLRDLRLLRDSLRQIARGGVPKIPGPVTTRDDGQVVARVFPSSLYDRLFFPGVSAEVWMEPGISEPELAEHQAAAYRSLGGTGRVSLVLGAGNVSSIGPTDALHKLFVDNSVVLYKMHPVNAYLGPLLEEGFAALVQRGVLRVVYGGAEEGDYLCTHSGVDDIHITGSDRTVEAIAFGTDADAQERRRQRRPRMDKPITSELGNVSPLIVVPGPWSDSDIEYQAENIVSSLTNNAGFNCNATRVVIVHGGWDLRGKLLDAIRRVLSQAPQRKAFYPGAEERFRSFLEAHPEAETYGEHRDGHLPWAFIPGVAADRDDEICFQTEAFCGVFCETPLEASSPAHFVRQAVDFANGRLWGNLNVTLLVHPSSRRDPKLSAALDQAEADLLYGTVSFNHWAAVGFALMNTPWGAYPGNDLYDIESGTGFVHNAHMFDRPQKTIVRSPFMAFPKPPWFVSHATCRKLSSDLAGFEAHPSPLKLPRIFWHALRA
jgi:acyl-CoA reductase-like NAD-dependent aldehyde dehydrogenase